MIPKFSIVEQTAVHLREGLSVGRWQEGLPGVRRIAAEFGVCHQTVRAALRRLEIEGRVAPQGQGRRRRPLLAEFAAEKGVRVAILLEHRLSELPLGLQRDLLEIRRGIEAAGHVCVFTTKTRAELRDDPSRMTRLVEETRAAIWLLVSARLAVVKWFETQSFPALAWGGCMAECSIPFVALDTSPSMRTIVRELGRLGHRRIVLIGSRNLRQPCPGQGFIRVFVEELAALGVRWNDYHLPDWEETPDGLRVLLDALFRVTPPQALILDQLWWAPAVVGFLARRGLRVPKDVSLVCLDQDETLAWCDPPIACLRYDERQPVRQILKWVFAAAAGKASRKSIAIPAEFDPAESIGPAVV